MPDLTVRQQQIVDFIQLRQEQEGICPSRAEIADHFGFRSRNAVNEHLRLIRQKGFIGETEGKMRALKLITPLQRHRQKVANIPIFGSIPAGFAQAKVQEAKGCVSIDIGTLGITPTPGTFALEVRGDSMIGKHIMDGDIVVLEQGVNPKSGEVVAALIDNESTLKTFLLNRGKPFLRAENPKYPDLIPAQELVIQGVFRALIRRAAG
ncbi:MAG: transcriptional repressor, LexA family [Verrucomicrobia bacterium]|jgi:repressor LexA|nr:transcriptional repressor, LexA family [Verrucomicrobiota bacterium]